MLPYVVLYIALFVVHSGQSNQRTAANYEILGQCQDHVAASAVATMGQQQTMSTMCESRTQCV